MPTGPPTSLSSFAAGVAPHPSPEVRHDAVMRDLAGIHHVALTVANRDASATWYASTLGFEELFREDAADRKACVMRFPTGGYSVGLVEHGSVEDHRFDARRRGLDHLAFTVGSREQLESWADHLSTVGVQHPGVVDIAPGAILNFNDPDGIALALFWDRE
jgi:glyoxylase I family protein